MADQVDEKGLLKIIRLLVWRTIRKKDEYEIPSLSVAEGLMRDRVFTNRKSTRGKMRRYASKRYIKKKKITYNTVDMVLTGDLQRDYGIYKDTDGRNVLGFTNKPQTVRTEGRKKKDGTVLSEPKAYTLRDPSTTKVAAEETRRGDALFIPPRKIRQKMYRIFTILAAKTMRSCIKELSNRG